MPQTFDERLVIDKAKQGSIIYNEHLIRYQFASQLVQGKTVLDIACGSGYGSKLLAQAGAAKVIALDASQSVINEAQKNFFHDKIEFRVGEAEKIALEENTIDLAVSLETIEHLPEEEVFLRELARVVKPDGLVVISTPNKKISQEKNPYHFKEFTRQEFERSLKRYFPFCLMINQSNALASYLKISAKQQGNIIMTSQAEPIYFLAVCSKKELPYLSDYNLVSLNPSALNNLYNNPGFKMVNQIYSLIVKIPGLKKFLNLLK